MEYILSLANVSTRGKQMLIRDLDRMEEKEDDKEEETNKSYQQEGGMEFEP